MIKMLRILLYILVISYVPCVLYAQVNPQYTSINQTNSSRANGCIPWTIRRVFAE